ncbi:PaaI family thioesterase [Desulfovibrio litoralis]|uniref:Uncharacterized domain 1-containing protein n=1 Tax=Desulfovibrio litoralis DSM 11393 TaxID=1121455 RepID=A0A1M7SCR8_9BACT|nr:PaaI family thioesterase [Desulfovibrio litoralis]SHN56278.1 uncharacterized domain 1-containing protein [Desulfovibrio litoralis DSM 11393]
MQTYLEDVVKTPQSVNPLLNTLGVKIVELSDKKAIFSLKVCENLAQGAGNLAGGILATIADEAMAHVLLKALDGHKQIVTTNLNVSFLRAVRQGLITCEAIVLKKGRSVAFVEAKIYNDEKELISTATATFHISQIK